MASRDGLRGMRDAAAGRLGFTLSELLVVTVLAGLLIVALHRIHVDQRRFARWQAEVVRGHDAYRVASSMLAGEFREAVPSDGDLVLHAPDSISVRAPVGLAYVCLSDPDPGFVSLTRTQGRLWEAGASDSLLVYTTGGWRTLVPAGEMSPGLRNVACPYAPERPDRVYRVHAALADSIPTGSPVRVFRRRTYHPVAADGRPALGRTDADGTEALVGPLLPDGLRFRLLDDAGGEPARMDEVAGVELRLVLPLVPVEAGRDGVADTLTLVFQGRNR